MSSPKHPTLPTSGLLVLLAGQLLPQIDFSIVNVALDAIAHTFHASETELELMVAVYGVAFAMCLAMGGRLGDNFGRRRLFNTGVLLFGIASLLCGIAPSMGFLLFARALQGVAAALLVPQILATIHVGLTGHRHSRALGFYGAIGGLAFIVGQVLGGFLVSADIAGMGWRSVFLINLPVCAVVLALSNRSIPETRREQHSSIDVPGTVVLTILILALLVPLALGPSLHWSLPCQASLLAVLPLAIGLWKLEKRQEQAGHFPLLPPTLMRQSSVRFGLVLALIFFSCWSGFMFVLALALQSGAGLSPLESGNAFIALGASYFAGSLLTPTTVNRLGRTFSLMTGCLIQMAGLLGLIWTLHTVWPHPTVLALVPATMLVGFGQSFIVGCFFRISLSDVPAEQAGAGSAMISTLQQASFGLGSALLGAVFAQSLHYSQGNYLNAVTSALAVEWCLMLILVVLAWGYHRHVGKASQLAALTPSA